LLSVEPFRSRHLSFFTAAGFEFLPFHFCLMLTHPSLVGVLKSWVGLEVPVLLQAFFLAFLCLDDFQCPFAGLDVGAFESSVG